MHNANMLKKKKHSKSTKHDRNLSDVLKDFGNVPNRGTVTSWTTCPLINKIKCSIKVTVHVLDFVVSHEGIHTSIIIWSIFFSLWLGKFEHCPTTTTKNNWEQKKSREAERKFHYVSNGFSTKLTTYERT